MIKLSKRAQSLIARDYRARYGVRLRFVDADGALLDSAVGVVDRLAMVKRARVHALQESVRWGDSYLFFVTPGVTSWMVPVVDGYRLIGGVIGGEVLTEEAGDDGQESIEHLVQHGATVGRAREYLGSLPVWPPSRCREAAEYLYRLVYDVSGLKPTLLDEQRERSLQQRQIAEEIHRRKRADDRTSSMDEEQLLLSLIRAGDKKGARRILNQMLGRVFLRSANLTVIRALMIELMGYLVRRAVEDSPELEPIMEKNHAWMARIIEVEDFETLAAVLRQALDDFMDQIYAIGYGKSNQHVARAMHYVSLHYRDALTLDDVARETGLSTYRIAHLIKEQTGKSLKRHIHYLRVKEARRLLEETSMDLAEIAVEVGFYDQSYFTRQFRTYTGITPARHRRLTRASARA